MAVVSALVYDAGYVLEKQALADLPPLKLGLAGLVRTAAASPRWLSGFVAMLGGLALQVGALTLAPVSVVQPIMAGGLIALAAAGSALLGERLDRRHVAALALVVVAVVAVGLSARGEGMLAQRVPGERFVLMIVVVAAVAAAAARWGLGGTGGHGDQVATVGLGGTAVSAGLLYGLGAVAEKAVATRLVSRGVIAGAISALGTPYPWIFLAATLAGMMVFQLGLQANPASLMASLTNTASTVCALIGASAVFGEAVLAPGWWSAARIAGFACVLAAVAVLAGGGEPVPGPADRARPDHATAP